MGLPFLDVRDDEPWIGGVQRLAEPRALGQDWGPERMVEKRAVWEAVGTTGWEVPPCGVRPAGGSALGAELCVCGSPVSLTAASQAG